MNILEPILTAAAEEHLKQCQLFRANSHLKLGVPGTADLTTLKPLPTPSQVYLQDVAKKTVVETETAVQAPPVVLPTEPSQAAGGSTASNSKWKKPALLALGALGLPAVGFGAKAVIDAYFDDKPDPQPTPVTRPADKLPKESVLQYLEDHGAHIYRGDQDDAQ